MKSIREISKIKSFKSDSYNYYFNKDTGLFIRWGETHNDDPEWAPAPEILDLEVSTICNGIGNGPCKCCYKSNTAVGKNMSLESFKKLFHKIPTNLTQIAFGIGDIHANPDLYPIMEYCTTNNYNTVVPNITINGYDMGPGDYATLAKFRGAVSVSRYNPPEVCYTAVNSLLDANVNQVNIHCILSNETLQDCLDTVDYVKSNERLKNKVAVVFLSLKQKGKRNTYTVIQDPIALQNFFKYIKESEIMFGFDSCGAPNVLRQHEQFGFMKETIEPCESGLFSLYIDVDGIAYPCSFCEGESNEEIQVLKGLDALNCNDFIKDIWNNKDMYEWKNKLLNSSSTCNCSYKNECRKCPVFKLTECI
jgi:hypothetical protein